MNIYKTSNKFYFNVSCHFLIRFLPKFILAVSGKILLILNYWFQVQAEVQSSFLKRVLFNMALRSKESEVKKSIVRKNSLWDSLVFKKIQEGMGGRLRLMVVGSAPLAGNVLTFARCALGCLIVEGYGQTECCAPVTLTVQVCKF